MENDLIIYNTLPEHIQKLYSSPDTSFFKRNLVETYNITEDKWDKLFTLIEEATLGKRDKNSIKIRLAQSNVTDSESIESLTNTVLDFLTPAFNYHANTKPNTDISTPLRTMEEDMQKVHGYGAFRKQFPREEESDAVPTYSSSQDQVVNRPKLADAPSYTPDESSSTQNP